MKNVLLVGNPNSGKTTLFNMLTKSNEHIGNWHGVTVESKEKVFDCDGEKFCLVDTPGIYSLTPFSMEEEVSIQTIQKNAGSKIVNLCDKSNLQRNLYLTMCLLEKRYDVLLAINEIDKKSLYKINVKSISKMLGIDVVLVNASKKTDGQKLKKMIKNSRRNAFLPYLNDNFKSKTEEEKCKIRYEFIDVILKNCTQKVGQTYGKNKIDKFVLNRFFAIPIFLLLMAAVFYLTFFSVGSLLSELMEKLLSFVTTPLMKFISQNTSVWFSSMMEKAVFGGVGSVLAFLPQIVLLFFFLSVLEESGYMSRVAFVFEDILGKIGLSGKSIYTILMGFGCSTSAIMTARTSEDKNAKIKTALLCPYMSCSAKIPIYVVIGGAFFGRVNLLVIMGLYMLGIVLSVFLVWIENKTVLKSDKQNFILEFPPYRKMSAKRIVLVLSKNAKEFLLKIGSIMIATNVIIWFLSSFDFLFRYTANFSGSMLETIGKFLAPVFLPLGFGRWTIVCCLLSGFVAKEVVVSSIAMFNGIDSNQAKLISNSILLSSSAVFFASKASALSFLVYCLLYTPCVSSIVMLRQEVGRKWALFAAISQLVVAYVLAFVVYNVAFAFEIFGFEKTFSFILGITLIGASLSVIVHKFKLAKRCNACNKKCAHFEKCKMSEKIDKKIHL